MEQSRSEEKKKSEKRQKVDLAQARLDPWEREMFDRNMRKAGFSGQADFIRYQTIYCHESGPKRNFIPCDRDDYRIAKMALDAVTSMTRGMARRNFESDDEMLIRFEELFLELKKTSGLFRAALGYNDR